MTGRAIAYFCTTIHSDTKQTATLQVSSNEGLAFWLNDGFLGYEDAERYAWYDLWKNPEHKGVTGKLDLEPGENALLVRYAAASTPAVASLHASRRKKIDDGLPAKRVTRAT